MNPTPLTTIANAPATSAAMVGVGHAQSTANQMANAMQAQHTAQTTGNANTTQTCAKILTQNSHKPAPNQSNAPHTQTSMFRSLETAAVTPPLFMPLSRVKPAKPRAEPTNTPARQEAPATQEAPGQAPSSAAPPIHEQAVVKSIELKREWIEPGIEALPITMQRDYPEPVISHPLRAKRWAYALVKFLCTD